jgi:hypothetical protein
MDLGTKQPAPGTLTEPPKGESKISYPGFSLNDEIAKKFATENSPKLGDCFAATVLIKVTRLESSQYGHSVGFDVQELDDVTPESSEDDEKPGEGKEKPAGEKSEPTAEDKAEKEALGYERPKGPKKEEPAVSAADLED